MFGSSVLDVAVGLAFLYFLLATIVTYVNEAIAWALQRRAKLLEDGVKRLVGSDLGQKVLQHDVVAPLAGAANGRLSYLPSRFFSTALLNLLWPDGVKLGETLPTPEQAPKAIGTLLAAYGPSVEGFVTGVEAWYDAAMDRLSGEYKRRTQQIVFVLGLALTLIVGADSVAVATGLWHQEAARSALNAALTSSSAQLGLQAAIDSLSKLPLPLGWGSLPASLTDWGLKVVGLLITTVAVSLGAPFWFDLMTSFGVSPRATGPKPGAAGAAPQAPQPPGAR